MTEKQHTFAKQHHQLTNINVWTPDSQWLVYDVRPSPASFTGLTIERVNVITGDVEVLYQAKNGAHVGVVTVSPVAPARYVFIHGPEYPDDEWHYDFHHRQGVIIQDGKIKNMDACDITPPYTAGALRGGSHVHVFSPDGSKLSFTYNDHVVHENNPAEESRNVGVAVPLKGVSVVKQHPREYDGHYFCVLISQTTSRPVPGSDDISRAYEEGWVGLCGYQKRDGQRQRWAIAFIGDTLTTDGRKVPEVFIVDLPADLNDYHREGKMVLSGTEMSLPAPPEGVVQRRLTFTHHQAWGGVAMQPRHWLRSSPDGEIIAFLMSDERGTIQLWGISPVGGDPVQITKGMHSIQSAFSWHPAGGNVTFVCDNSVMICDTDSGQTRRLTPYTKQPPCEEAVVFSPDGKQIAYMREVDGFRQLFSVTLDEV